MVHLSHPRLNVKEQYRLGPLIYGGLQLKEKEYTELKNLENPTGNNLIIFSICVILLIIAE